MDHLQENLKLILYDSKKWQQQPTKFAAHAIYLGARLRLLSFFMLDEKCSQTVWIMIRNRATARATKLYTILLLFLLLFLNQNMDRLFKKH